MCGQCGTRICVDSVVHRESTTTAPHSPNTYARVPKAGDGSRAGFMAIIATTVVVQCLIVPPSFYQAGACATPEGGRGHRGERRHGGPAHRCCGGRPAGLAVPCTPYKLGLADSLWFPGHGKAVYRVGNDRVPINTCGDGNYDFIGFRPTPTPTLAIKADRLAEEGVVEETRNSGSRSVTALAINESHPRRWQLRPVGLTKHSGLLPPLPSRPVVGFQNRIQPSGRCLAGPDDALLTENAMGPARLVIKCRCSDANRMSVLVHHFHIPQASASSRTNISTF
ncbi:unnamed protein product [Urochloa humidicola]